MWPLKYNLLDLFVLGAAVDQGVSEINYTLDYIDSEDFITHTCNAGKSLLLTHVMQVRVYYSHM